ncbi:hypothetical protein SAY86_028945 [Trapa natans]|uniref:Uncharacterized protein n=1 Tax=Trapa natans TaxID=22666 RepID=A0AAN7M2Z4_TRANT|nr:hypothetical protein SAY86_028945 [Trapa natans]
MGSDKNHPSSHPFFFHHHHHHHGKKDLKDVPKGFMAVMVGRGDKHERFVIPVAYINHPLFRQLLREAEEEFGFDHKGPITIPCRIEVFRSIQDSIDRENLTLHHHSHSLCFRV